MQTCKQVNFSDIRGKIIKSAISCNDNEIRFLCSDNTEYRMHHEQDCCESVWIESVSGGDLSDLNDQMILEAYESSNHLDYPDSDDSITWTFYTIRTNRSTLTIRWYGSSNGYYSESVTFYKIENEDRNE